MINSQAEENYLKAIYHLSQSEPVGSTSTNILADKLSIRPASVTSMLKKLKAKNLIHYEPYGKVVLTIQGQNLAIEVVRKHRLWEVFLVETLGFTWDEVHEVAEQLEHIQSKKLIEKLDAFLLHPKKDPHGDPIPKADGSINQIEKKNLQDAEAGKEYEVISVSDTSSAFLQYLIEHNIGLGCILKLIRKHSFDDSLLIELTSGQQLTLSKEAAAHLQVI